jgi:hypothetical protein
MELNLTQALAMALIMASAVIFFIREQKFGWKEKSLRSFTKTMLQGDIQIHKEMLGNVLVVNCFIPESETSRIGKTFSLKLDVFSGNFTVRKSLDKTYDNEDDIYKIIGKYTLTEKEHVRLKSLISQNTELADLQKEVIKQFSWYETR